MSQQSLKSNRYVPTNFVSYNWFITIVQDPVGELLEITLYNDEEGEETTIIYRTT